MVHAPRAGATAKKVTAWTSFLLHSVPHCSQSTLTHHREQTLQERPFHVNLYSCEVPGCSVSFFLTLIHTSPRRSDYYQVCLTVLFPVTAQAVLGPCTLLPPPPPPMPGCQTSEIPNHVTFNSSHLFFPSSCPFKTKQTLATHTRSQLWPGCQGYCSKAAIPLRRQEPFVDLMPGCPLLLTACILSQIPDLRRPS